MKTQTEHISNKKYHYFYKITNRLNGMFYYGIHSTDDLNDGYMGSGKRLKYAIKQYGIKNFNKEIIKFFSSLTELSNYEQEIVNEELLNNPKCYNLVKGGYFLEGDAVLKLRQTYKDKQHQQGKNNSQYGTCWVMKNNESIKINKNQLDSYINNGWVKGRRIKNTEKIIKANREYQHIWKDGKTTRVKQQDVQKYLDEGWVIGRSDPKSKILHKTSMTKDESIANASNYIRVRDKNDNIFVVNRTDQRYISGELVSYNKGYCHVVDNKGNKLLVKVDDPRIKTGKLQHSSKRAKDRIIIRNIETNEYFSVYNDDERLNNPLFVKTTTGLKYSKEQKEKIRKAKTENKMTWINDGIKHKYIEVSKVDKFLEENKNWKLGRIKKNK